MGVHDCETSEEDLFVQVFSCNKQESMSISSRMSSSRMSSKAFVLEP